MNNYSKEIRLFPDTSQKERVVVLGRGDLRISLTGKCNLGCGYCHNEGQVKCDHTPEIWKPSAQDVIDLIRLGVKHGVRSVKFTGGEPLMFHEFPQLMAAVTSAEFSGIPFSVVSNGLMLLNPQSREQFIQYPLQKVNFGIDSLLPGERSKPESPNGVKGQNLFHKVVLPVWKEWEKMGRQVVINSVFTGDVDRIMSVLNAAVPELITVSVIELNQPKGVRGSTRTAFDNVMQMVQERYSLSRGYDPTLDQRQLIDQENRVRVRFYQDHCADENCDLCGRLHLRVSPSSDGWRIMPCYLGTPAKGIDIMDDNHNLNDDLLIRSFASLGLGPTWIEAVSGSSLSTGSDELG